MDLDLWGWFRQYRQEAYRVKNDEKLKLPNLFSEAWDYFETQPLKAMSLLTQGRELAKKLNEPCWMLFHDYWRCEGQLFYLDDAKAGLDMAVRIAAEAHKPLYERCPIRARVFRILVDAYSANDPVGYADQIYKTVEYLEKEVPMDHDTRCLLQAKRAYMAYVFDRLDEAVDESQRFMAMVELYDFQHAYAHQMLCKYLYMRGDVDAALKHAQEGEVMARRADRKSLLASFAAWQALLNHKQGDAETSQSFYRVAASRQQALGVTASMAYYDAMSEYLELSGQPEEALRLRDQEMVEAKKSNSLYGIVEAMTKRCQLLARMGRPLTEDLKIAREMAQKFLKPELALAKLDKIERGEG